MRVALVSLNAKDCDAVGNQIAEKFAFFREHAADVRVFVQSTERLHPALAGHCQAVTAEPQGDFWDFLSSADLVCVEYSQYFSLLSLLPLLAGGRARILFDYHSVTPPEFWAGYNPEALVKGQEQRGLAWCADLAIAHSQFTRRELEQNAGLPAARMQVLGLPVDCSPATPKAASGLGLEGCKVILFVGRMAPNKRPALLIEALRYLADLQPAVHVVFAGDNGDLYQSEARRCMGAAREHGLSDRVHVLGMVPESQLQAIYQEADVLVVPSLWEGFCVPVLEAMAAGVPVIAARTSALPETVGSAGLTFNADDASDLARQLRRVLQSRPVEVSANGSTPVDPPLAIVSARFGDGFAGGAERSLRRVGMALRQMGRQVEVFTSCCSQEGGGPNDFPAGTSNDHGLVVHRYPLEEGATVPRGLLAALEARIGAFEAVITGPFVSPVAAEVMSIWPEKTVLVPCFHDEPATRKDGVASHCDRALGVWYHSATEQTLAQSLLGINHPGASVLGTFIEMEAAASPGAGRAKIGPVPYVIYCGRRSPEKNLPMLYELARRFESEYPGMVKFAFVGDGGLAVPSESWAVDLGFVSDQERRDLVAGAAALVQLSTNESLSLAALEAWALGTPVIGHRQCQVMAEHIQRSGGGLLVANFEEFEAALDLCVERPEFRQQLGECGRDYVRKEFGSAQVFMQRVTAALTELREPIALRMRNRGRQRAAGFDRSLWRQKFAGLVERLLDSPPRETRREVRLEPHSAACTTQPGGAVMTTVRVINTGTVPAVAEGPARTTLMGEIVDAEGAVVRSLRPAASLPGLLIPGRALPASIALPVPHELGNFTIRLWAQWESETGTQRGPIAVMQLEVNLPDRAELGGANYSLLADVQTALAEAERIRSLPDTYTDVTTGALSGVKAKVKQKLLGNFKKGYVDVIARQQSDYNARLVLAVEALAECCATLDHALRQMQVRVTTLESQQLGAREEDLIQDEVRNDMEEVDA